MNSTRATWRLAPRQPMLAVVLIDARKGVLKQTRRHSFIASLLGIRHVVIAVNKIDLMDYSKEVFDRIVAEYSAFAKEFGFETVTTHTDVGALW